MDQAQFLPGDDPDLVPSWLTRLAAISLRLLLVIAAAAVVLWFAALIWTSTVSIIVALIVSATFAPYVLWLRNRGWSRTAAALTVTALAVLVIVGTVLLIWAFFFFTSRPPIARNYYILCPVALLTGYLAFGSLVETPRARRWAVARARATCSSRSATQDGPPGSSSTRSRRTPGSPWRPTRT